MTRKQKKLLRRILSASVFFGIALCGSIWSKWLGASFLWEKSWGRFAVYLVPYLTVGFSVLRKAVSGISRGQIFDENVLMALATVGALAIGEYPEAVFVLLFYEVGELFESVAVGKSRRSIAALMDIRPDTASVVREEGEVTLSPEEVAVGELLMIRPGERIPLDGIVTEGVSAVDTAALTGESVPRDVSVGDEVMSGCINRSGLLRVRVTKPYGESTAVKILRLVEDSAANKAKTEGFITRFAVGYTPVVVIGALLVATLPPLFIGGWSKWLYRALNFLVISCPCALVISVPLTFFSGMGAASGRGVLIKGSGYLERLASCKIAVFDKTGTLTEGSFRVTEICAEAEQKEEVLTLAALAEVYSDHPIALSLRAAYPKVPDVGRIGGVQEVAGRGVSAVIDGKRVLVGNAALMEEHSLRYARLDEGGTAVHVACDGQYLGYILLSDAVKEGTADALTALRRLGVGHQVMLTGDNRATAAAVAKGLSLDGYRAELLPDGKVAEVEALLKEKQQGETLIFVGDGINDAPVLARADVGVAMGALGSDAAMEAADVVIMNDDLRRLGDAVKIARKTKTIVWQNVIFSLAVKVGVLLFSLFGVVPMWMAVFADVGVMVLAVLNAMRAMKA